MARKRPKVSLQIAFAVLAGIILACLALSLATRPDLRNAFGSTDTRLIKAVYACVRDDILPRDVEGKVGFPASFNSEASDEWDWFDLEKSPIRPDPEEAAPLPELLTGKNFVFWVRPLRHEELKVVGIFWPLNGKPVVFFGCLGPYN